jgi:spermidine synthase
LKKYLIFNKSGLLTLLFFLSGAVSLLYEIVWAKQLQFLFGSSIYSISTIISSFFCGMALGGYLLGRWNTEKNPIVIYAVIETVIGLYCLASFFFIDVADVIYLSLAPALSASVVLSVLCKFLLSFFVLIIPTTLMGGSLPVLSRYVQATTGNHGSKIGKLYGANTLGAVVGAWVTGFFLIEKYGLSKTMMIGAYISIAIGAVGIALSKSRKQKEISETKKAEPLIVSSSLSRQCLVAYGISGFCALAYEVVWTRVLLQSIPSSTYTFSLILIIYLLGIAIGSIVASWLTVRMKSPAAWFAVIQMVLAISVLSSVKLSEKNVLYDGLIYSGWTNYLLAMALKTSLLIFIPSLLMGGLFPVMVQWYKDLSKDIGDSVGKIYSINTIGGIAGSFFAGFLLIPFLGATKSIVLLAAINLMLGIFFIREIPFINTLAKWKYAVASVLVITFFIIAGMNGKWIEPMIPEGYRQVFYNEGSSATISVYQSTVPGRENIRILKENGVYQSGGTDEGALIAQRRQGHLAILLHDQPDSVLVIGLATGITLSAIAEHKKVKHIDCVELVSAQLDAAKLFEPENQHVLSNPRVNMIIDDGRSYIKTTSSKYNVIVGDLFQMSSAGTSTLFSIEHLHACKSHLSGNGVMVQYIPLQQITEDNLKSVMQSFIHVFPFVQVSVCDASAQKPVLAIVASVSKIRLNISELKARIESSGAVTLSEVGYDDPYLIIGQCVMQTEAVKKYGSHFPLVTLDRQLMEFSAPRVLTEPREQRVRLIMSGLLVSSSPLEVEIPTEGTAKILETLNLYVQANKNIVIAELAIEMQSWATAEKILTESLQKIPSHFDIRRLLGRTNVFLAIDLLKQRKTEAAIAKLNKAKGLGIKDVLVPQLLEATKKTKQ